MSDVIGEIAYAGEIPVLESFAKVVSFSCALLITFATPEDVRKAIADGRCAFEWPGEPTVITEPPGD